MVLMKKMSGWHAIAAGMASYQAGIIYFSRRTTEGASICRQRHSNELAQCSMREELPSMAVSTAQ